MTSNDINFGTKLHSRVELVDLLQTPGLHLSLVHDKAWLKYAVQTWGTLRKTPFIDFPR